MTALFIRPDADSVDGSWLNESASNTNLFDSVNETSPSDTDYISSTTDGDKVRLRLSDPTTTPDAPFLIRYRTKREGFDKCDLVGRLYQGTTQKAYWENAALTTNFADYTYTLSTAELAGISDFNDLYVEFEYKTRADHLGSQIDLNFATSTYYEAGALAPAITDYLSCSRASIGYATNADGTVTSFTNDTFRVTNLGLLAEESRTNLVLWNRDLTNGVWTATNITALKDQTGPDGVSNSASSLLATAGNGTILQSITDASQDRCQSAYVKRITGTGTINMTMDNGSTWTAISVTSSWQQLYVPKQTTANPIVGFRIVTSGDKIAVDFVQNEVSSNGSLGSMASSPIPTTSASAVRALDSITTTGSAQSVLAGTAGTVVFNVKHIPFTSINAYETMLGDNTEYTSVFNPAGDGSAVCAKNGGAQLSTVDFSASGLYSTGVKIGASWDAAPARSIVGAGTTVNTDANTLGWPQAKIGSGFNNNNQASFLYFRRLTVWTTRLSDTVLQSLAAP